MNERREDAKRVCQIRQQGDLPRGYPETDAQKRGDDQQSELRFGIAGYFVLHIGSFLPCKIGALDYE